MIKKILVIFVFLNVVVLVAGYNFVQESMARSILLQESVVLKIPKGSSLKTVAQILSEHDLLAAPPVFIAYARFNKLSHSIKAGEYRFDGKVSPLSILDQLIRGNVVFYTVTLVEGKRYKEMLEHIWQQPHITPVLKEKTEGDVISLLGVGYGRMEGLLFPDTYRYSDGETDLSIVKRAYRKMDLVLGQEWEVRAKDLPYINAYDALIMASIVEKETGLASERPEIAGVFVRRLRKNMRLQTDPTVIYGLGDDYNGNIKRKHLKMKTPYNTYVINGLPPTPIALPGREAIHAALHPAQGKALYFVARGDGSHEFTDNFTDHNKAVVKFQKRRVKNYRSSPQN